MPVSKSNATTFTAVNDISDTSAYPVFVGDATGFVIPKTNTNLAYNASTATLTSPNINVDTISEKTSANGVLIDGMQIKDSLVVGGAGAGVANSSLSTTAGDIGGAWLTYNPTWAGSTGNPDIGNGTISAKYTQRGKTIHLILCVTMGSTTTYGSGYWTFTLPVTAAASGRGSGFGAFHCYDSTASSTQYMAAGYCLSTSTLVLDVGTGARDNVRSVAPFTWAGSDVLVGEFTYPAA